MTDEIVLDLSKWAVVGLHLTDPFSDDTTLFVRLKHNLDAHYRVVVFRAVTGVENCDSILSSIEPVIVDTSSRGWDRTQRFEVTDLDDAGPYFYAAEFDVIDTEYWRDPLYTE